MFTISVLTRESLLKFIVAFTHYVRASKVKIRCHAEFISAPHMIFTPDRWPACLLYT